MTAFAPLTLAASSSSAPVSASASAAAGGVAIQTHRLCLSAPSPFPSSCFTVAVRYEADPLSQAVVSLSLDDAAAQFPDLRRWIDARLANPLLKLDVAGLCWGINSYWLAVLVRAHLWVQLAQRYHAAATPAAATAAPAAAAHIHRHNMSFRSPSDPTMQALLSCAVALDPWTGEPQLVPELSVCGASASAGAVEREAKKLFRALLRDSLAAPGSAASVAAGSSVAASAAAVARAAEGVFGILFG